MPMQDERTVHEDIDLQADVLVLGGGPAGTWAALTAARQGARVVLADKAYCGVSGAAAASNNSVWYVPDRQDFGKHFDERYESGGYLAERDWVYAVLEGAVRQLHILEELGYPFPRTRDGQINYASLRGPDYMRLMRRAIQRAGVTILDHSPVSGLCKRDDIVVGAYGQTREGARWRVSAVATIVATGGCGFMGGALGTNVCTGEGHLAAAEAGVEFSGMEFSNQYGFAMAHASVTKGLPFIWASYYRQSGAQIDTDNEEPFVAVAKAMIEEPVLAVFDRADRDIETWLRSAQANAFLPYDRLGIDPFKERFPVSLRLEGTVRGTGGIHLKSRDCATNVPGLYAAGDAASREPIVGGRSGGGSPNAAWAVVTGAWAGAAAATYAQECRYSLPVTQSHFEGQDEGHLADPVATMSLIKNEVWPLQKNVFRSQQGLLSALRQLDEAWEAPAPTYVSYNEGRRAKALLFSARLAYHCALRRKESRALHRRTDYPLVASGPVTRQLARGLDVFTIRDIVVAGDQ
jgi:succinate dehydrogenase/fumarate reductase flavoprotein subunit